MLVKGLGTPGSAVIPSRTWPVRDLMETCRKYGRVLVET